MDPYTRKMLEEDPFEQPEVAARVKESFDSRNRLNAARLAGPVEQEAKPPEEQWLIDFRLGNSFQAFAPQSLWETYNWDASLDALSHSLSPSTFGQIFSFHLVKDLHGGWCIQQHATDERFHQPDLPFPDSIVMSTESRRHEGD